MYDMMVFEKRKEKGRRLIAGRGGIRDFGASGDGFMVSGGEGIGPCGDRLSTARVSRSG
jgi:hypothetical protein